jgi:predicted nucleic acid-binding protein
MYFLDSSFLIDYADADRSGHDAAVSFLEENENSPFAAPSVVMYEIYRGAARTGRGVEAAAEDFGWVRTVGFGDGEAQTAARLYADTLDDGERINSADILIAAVVMENGGRLVTGDSDFSHVDGLDVVDYRSD